MKKPSKSNIEKLKKMDDSMIDYSDIPETDEEFWSDALIDAPENKVNISVSIDKDISIWLNDLGKDHSNIVNHLLRSYYMTYKQLDTKVQK